MSEEITLASQVRLADDVVFRDLQGEIVILHLKTGVYSGLDPVATRLWHLIREHGCLQKVLDSLLEEYKVTAAQGEGDLLRFVAQLREQQLIEVCRPPA
jgi:hypothetical protein